MLDIQDFNAPVATILKKETEKAVEVKYKREERQFKISKAAYITGARSASSIDQLPIYISKEQENRKVYPEISEK